jgi:hypothetical protein
MPMRSSGTVNGKPQKKTTERMPKSIEATARDDGFPSAGFGAGGVHGCATSGARGTFTERSGPEAGSVGSL